MGIANGLSSGYGFMVWFLFGVDAKIRARVNRVKYPGHIATSFPRVLSYPSLEKKISDLFFWLCLLLVYGRHVGANRVHRRGGRAGPSISMPPRGITGVHDSHFLNHCVNYNLFRPVLQCTEKQPHVDLNDKDDNYDGALNK